MEFKDIEKEIDKLGKKLERLDKKDYKHVNNFEDWLEYEKSEDYKKSNIQRAECYAKIYELQKQYKKQALEKLKKDDKLFDLCMFSMSTLEIKRFMKFAYGEKGV